MMKTYLAESAECLTPVFNLYLARTQILGNTSSDAHCH